MMIEVERPFEAEQILESIRQGTVPKQHASELMVGRTFWLEALCDDMAFVAKGASRIRFLSAPYGGGKSHFLSVIEQVAREKDFLVANVELHSREAPMDRFEVIFPKIMRNLTCKSDTNVLETVLKRWIYSSQFYDRQTLNHAARAVSQSIDFQSALRAFVERVDSTYSEDDYIKQAVIGWLCGDSISPILKKHTQIRNKITITNVSEIFGSFLRVVRRSDFSGVTILLDEAEAITSLTQSRKRDEANQNIRKLLDNANFHEGLLIVFATTPSFIEDEQRGAKSYPALWDRIRTVVRTPKNVSPNKRSLIIKFEPPGKSELRKVANLVVRLHSIAYDWVPKDRLSDELLRKFIDKYLHISSERVYRSFLRVLVAVLDALEQDQDVLNADTLIENIDFGE